MTPKLHLPLLLPLLLLSLSSLRPAISHCFPRGTASNLPNPVPHPSPSSPNCPPPTPSPPPATHAASPPTSSSSPSNSNPVSAAAKAICDRTDHPDLCLTSVQFLLPSLNGHVDARSMLKLQIQTLQYKTQSVCALATLLMNNPTIDDDSASCYKEALSCLGDALDNINKSLAALEAGDAGTLGTMLDALPTNYDDASNEFMDWVEPPPFFNDIDEFCHWSSNLLAIRDMII